MALGFDTQKRTVWTLGVVSAALTGALIAPALALVALL
jgi:hypothetical protein